MANILDIDFTKRVTHFPQDHELNIKDFDNPLTPAIAVVNFDFPDDCYCPNIPVPSKDGLNIYPLHGENVYITGPDMYLALQLGAKIRILRGYICPVLLKDDKPSQCLAHAVKTLVQERILSKTLYKDKPLIEAILKELVCFSYGKTGQNVSPKTMYNAKIMKHSDAKPSVVSSPYHAAYTTALVRCMLIACINQIHNLGYRVYSVTTDGFITNAPIETVHSIDAYGFSKIFQEGRYTLNQTRDACDANQVWQPKHFNDSFLNITTRGNVATNDKGVLAHNSYITGKSKDSRADRDAFIIDVLTRNGRLECSTEVWTSLSDMVERKSDLLVTKNIRHISMDFDYKRCPIIETAIDTPVHYDSKDGKRHVDTVIAEFDTKPYYNAEEFVRYRDVVKSEKSIKVVSDLERVKVKSEKGTKGKIGRDLNRKILLSILMGYRAGKYKIPCLDGLKQSEIIKIVNSWNISKISVSDWKNCSRKDRQLNMLPYDMVKETLKLIQNNNL